MKDSFLLPRLMDRQEVINSILDRIMTLAVEKAWRVEIEEAKGKRSLAQNRYLWGCVYPTILEAGKLDGWEATEIHDYVLGEFFGWETVTGFGRKKIRPIRRSSKLTKTEFADFIAFIQRRMAEHGIIVPDADPEYDLKEDYA
jgi:hypothetical protein